MFPRRQSNGKYTNTVKCWVETVAVQCKDDREE